MILLLHCIVFLVLVGGAATHDSYNYIVRRKAAVASGNGFETSKDSFHRTPGVQSCSRLDAICSSDSKNCSFCSCGKDKTFFSYKHGCLDKDDVHKATNVDDCLYFHHQVGKIPTVTANTFASNWCPDIDIPSVHQDRYKQCKVKKVYRNDIVNGKKKLVSQSISGNIFSLIDNQKGGKCLKCTQANCDLKNLDGHVIKVELYCKSTGPTAPPFNECLVFKKDGDSHKFDSNGPGVTSLPMTTPTTTTTTKTTSTSAPSAATSKVVTTHTHTQQTPLTTTTTTTTTATPIATTTVKGTDSVKTDASTQTTTSKFSLKTTEGDRKVFAAKKREHDNERSSSEIAVPIIVGVGVFLLVAFVVFAVVVLKYRKKKIRRKIGNVRFAFNNFTQELWNSTPPSSNGSVDKNSKLDGEFVDLEDTRYVDISQDKHQQPNYETMKPKRNSGTNEYCKPSEVNVLSRSPDDKRQSNAYYKNGGNMITPEKENCYYGGSKQQNGKKYCGDNKQENIYYGCGSLSQQSTQTENLYYGEGGSASRENIYYGGSALHSKNKRSPENGNSVNKTYNNYYQSTSQSQQQKNDDSVAPIKQIQNPYYQGIAMNEEITGKQQQQPHPRQPQENLYQGISDLNLHQELTLSTPLPGRSSDYAEPAPVFSTLPPVYSTINRATLLEKK